MGRRPVVLCVDDSPSLLEGWKMLMEQNGYRVLTASDGKEALEVFVSHSVDLVLLDYYMPQMNGSAAALRMKRLKPDIPIVLLSSDERLPAPDLETADCFLPKSVSIDGLVEKVDHFLSLRYLFEPLADLKGKGQKAAQNWEDITH